MKRSPPTERRFENASATPASARPSQVARLIEWPTLALAAVIHVGWLLVTFEHARLPLPLLILLGGWFTAWHGSLQHEVIHGHPTPWRRLNTWLAAAPLSLWLPFARYRQSHLAHHATDALTDPRYDPESRYLASGSGLAHGGRRLLARLQASLLGRLVVGPAAEISGFLISEVRGLIGDEPGMRLSWTVHGLALAPLLAWLHFACRLSLPDYVCCFVYPGAALSLLRSFAEHRADPLLAHRVAVVERAPLLGLLFLNNNLHAAHHAWPGAPWFQLDALYEANREQLLEANGGLVYDGYGEIVRRFMLRAHDRIEHPVPRTVWQGAAT